METTIVRSDADIVRHQGGAPPVLQFNREQIETIRAAIMPQGSSDTELQLFLHQCRRTGLDPLTRQIYALRMGGKLTIQVSIDGFRLVAERTGLYAGQVGPQWCGEDGQWCEVWLRKEAPAAARVGVLRHGFAGPLWGIATFAEFCRTKDGRPIELWAKMPAIMLAKCAESQALRKAFPNELSGLYTPDEMDQARGNGAPPRVQRAVTGNERGTYAGNTIDRSLPAGNACADCGKALTASQVQISTRNFGRPLCPAHQKNASPGAVNNQGAVSFPPPADDAKRPRDHAFAAWGEFCSAYALDKNDQALRLEETAKVLGSMPASWNDLNADQLTTLARMFKAQAQEEHERQAEAGHADDNLPYEDPFTEE